MKVSYGFVFYFEIFLVALTVSLIFLYFKPIRNLVFGVIDKYKIGQGPLYNTLWWIVFVVIGIILVDSVLTFSVLRNSLEMGTCFKT